MAKSEKHTLRGPGHRRKIRIHKINFQNDNDPDDNLNGLYIEVKALDTGEFLNLVTLVEMNYDRIGPEEVKSIDDMFTTFSTKLEYWNMTDEEDTPLPPTKESLYTLELFDVIAMITSYLGAVAGVFAPLALPSNSGDEFPGGSVPMEVSSPSPTN